jgi:hypothetical protein
MSHLVQHSQYRQTQQYSSCSALPSVRLPVHALMIQLRSLLCCICRPLYVVCRYLFLVTNSLSSSALAVWQASDWTGICRYWQLEAGQDYCSGALYLDECFTAKLSEAADSTCSMWWNWEGQPCDSALCAF